MFLVARVAKAMKELPGMDVTGSGQGHHHSLAWIGVLNVVSKESEEHFSVLCATEVAFKLGCVLQHPATYTLPD